MSESTAGIKTLSINRYEENLRRVKKIIEYIYNYYFYKET